MFSALNKLSQLCSHVNFEGSRKDVYTIKHTKPQVKCTASVLHEILPCRGNTHISGAASTFDSINTLTTFGKSKEATWRYTVVSVVAHLTFTHERLSEYITKSIPEAYTSQKGGAACVSIPSIAKEETRFSEGAP